MSSKVEPIGWKHGVGASFVEANVAAVSYSIEYSAGYILSPYVLYLTSIQKVVKRGRILQNLMSICKRLTNTSSALFYTLCVCVALYSLTLEKNPPKKNKNPFFFFGDGLFYTVIAALSTLQHVLVRLKLGSTTH